MKTKSGGSGVQVARKMQDREIPQLLQGENPETQHAADARRWIAIYSQLLAFNEELLNRLHREVGGSAGQRRWRSTTGLRNRSSPASANASPSGSDATGSLPASMSTRPRASSTAPTAPSR
jgi:hypothetical protein